MNWYVSYHKFLSQGNSVLSYSITNSLPHLFLTLNCFKQCSVTFSLQIMLASAYMCACVCLYGWSLYMVWGFLQHVAMSREGRQRGMAFVTHCQRPLGVSFSVFCWPKRYLPFLHSWGSTRDPSPLREEC